MGKQPIGSVGKREKKDGASAGKIVDSGTMWIMCQTIDFTIDLMIRDYH